MEYFSTDYFSADYFSADYFSGAAGSEVVGQIGVTIDLIKPRALGNVGYWSTNYWSIDYWSENYWADQYLEPYFAGTFFPATGFGGVLGTTLANATGAFVGSVTQVENFDLNVNFGVAWTLSAYEIYTGSSAVTLDDLTSSVTGTFVAADGRLGSVAATLQNATSAFTGTNADPANATGTIGTTLTLSQTASFSGTFVDPDAFEGVLTGSLQSFTSAIQGTYDSGTFTGTIPNQTLADFTIAAAGNFYDANANVGYMASSVLFTANFDGTAVGDQVITSIRFDRQSNDTTRAGSDNRRIRASKGGRKRA